LEKSNKKLQTMRGKGKNRERMAYEKCDLLMRKKSGTCKEEKGDNKERLNFVHPVRGGRGKEMGKRRTSSKQKSKVLTIASWWRRSLTCSCSRVNKNRALWERDKS